MPVQVCFTISDAHAANVRQALLDEAHSEQEQAQMTNAQKTDAARQVVVKMIRHLYTRWRTARESEIDSGVT